MARAYSHGGDTVVEVFLLDAVVNWRWPDDGMEQLRMAHDFRNDLVRLELDHDDARTQVWATVPEVAAAHTAAAEARETLAAADNQVKQANQKLGYAKHTGRGVREAEQRLKGAEDDRRDAAAVSKSLATAVKDAETRHRSQVKDLLAETRKQFDQRAVQLKKDYISAGLLWCTAADVADKHRVRVARMIALRAQGRPAQLRFRRWDGSGSITLILQRQQDKPPRTPELIADGDKSPWRGQFWLRPWMPEQEFEQLPRHEQRAFYKSGRARIRVRATNAEKGPAWIDVPVYVQRMMPADADIVQAQLVRQVIGTQTHTQLCVTARVPSPEPKTTGPTVAVHTGWRARGDGSLRVAVWHSSSPLEIPDHLREVLVAAEKSSTWGEIIVPKRWRSYHGKGSDIASIRAQHQDTIRDKLVAWLTEHGPITTPWTNRDGEPIELTTALVERWRSPSRFARLADWWRTDPPKNGQEITDLLGEWWERDRHLNDYHTGVSRRLVTIRKDRWRRVAAWLTQQAGVVVIDDTDLAKISRSSKQQDEPTREAARRNRTIAAPGELRTAIKLAAESRGVPVHPASSDGITTVHRQCGYRNTRGPEYAEGVMVTCAGCGAQYDQDINAVQWLSANTKGPSPR